MDDIRRQIMSLRNLESDEVYEFPEAVEAADTMERLLAVYEAAEEFRKVWQHHCDRQGELSKSLEDARVCYELSEAITAVKDS